MFGARYCTLVDEMTTAVCRQNLMMFGLKRSPVMFGSPGAKANSFVVDWLTVMMLPLDGPARRPGMTANRHVTLTQGKHTMPW